MYVSHYLDDVVVWAPAKVNLFLEVLGKRPDGYHEIATLMVALRLFDTLILRADASGTLALQCSQPTLSSGPDNLVMKAARLLQERTGCNRGAQIRLVKRIPMAAGLAGGSTDAAGTLLGLNRLWNLGLSLDELAKISAEIGSDIPFFFQTPAAWCTGRGEIVKPAKIGNPIDLVLLCPAFGLSTPAVYKNVVVPAQPESGDRIRAALEQGEIDSVGRLLHNRLQTAAERVDDRIADYARMLADLKPAGHLMSGSGSTLYAVCRSPEDADRIAAGLRTHTKAHDARIIVTRTL